MTEYRIMARPVADDGQCTYTLVEAHINRDGSVAEVADPVFAAWTVSDLRAMLATALIQASSGAVFHADEVVGDRDLVDVPF